MRRARVRGELEFESVRELRMESGEQLTASFFVYREARRLLKGVLQKRFSYLLIPVARQESLQHREGLLGAVRRHHVARPRDGQESELTTSSVLHESSGGNGGAVVVRGPGPDPFAARRETTVPLPKPPRPLLGAEVRHLPIEVAGIAVIYGVCEREGLKNNIKRCLLYTSPSPRD